MDKEVKKWRNFNRENRVRNVIDIKNGEFIVLSYFTRWLFYLQVLEDTINYVSNVIRLRHWRSIAVMVTLNDAAKHSEQHFME